MNWQEVKNNNPKAFEALQTRVRDVYVYNVSENDFTDYETGFMRVRELYDFFDERGVIIEIGVDWTAEPKYCYRAVPSYGRTELNDFWSDLFYKRTEAEEQAFLRAFQLLEDKLKEGR